jgi:CheY-like chemotaxis protein
MEEAPKVLIAEDDRMTQRILQATLTQHPQLKGHGFQLVMAADGMEAMERFAEALPRLVIVDLFMPRLDGFSVCRAIRESEHGSRVPIIVTSAVWKQPEMLEQLKSDYGVTFVEKPFQIDDLIAAVQTALLTGPSN